MWGFGGRHYWGRKEGGKVEGIVVVFAWMSSQDKHLKNYVDLYSSIGWNSLVCHSQFLNLFFPDKAESLALEIVSELVQELKIQPCPVVFASFSGGPKACMYKVLHIIEGKCDTQVNLDDFRLVKDSVSGNIFDSTPVDFTSDLGTRFVLHPSVLKISHPPRVVTWIANGISSSLDAVFLSRFESQRAEYWQTLYSTISMGAPYLILCSEDDDLAPFQIICNFATSLKDLGADVKLVKWNSSSHVGHFRNYPVEYRAAVTELLGKAVAIYSQRIRQLEGKKLGLEVTDGEISDPFHNMRKAASRSNQSFERITLDLNNHFVVPGSVEYHEDRGIGSVHDERKEHYIPLSSPPKIGVHGILGQFLFDVCVPKKCRKLGYRVITHIEKRASYFWWETFAFQPYEMLTPLKIMKFLVEVFVDFTAYGFLKHDNFYPNKNECKEPSVNLYDVDERSLYWNNCERSTPNFYPYF